MKKLNSQINRDKFKNKCCLSKGISIIRISYNLSSVQVKSRLLSELHNRYNAGNHTARVVRL